MNWGTLDPFVEGGSALGRRVANATFLKALLRADPYDSYHFFLSDEARSETFIPWVEEHFPALVRRGAVVTGSHLDLPRRLEETSFHCMHLSDIFTRYTRLVETRDHCGMNIFPVTGVTHSLSYRDFMPEYLRHIWPGVSSRDAVIVTSESARLVLERVFHGLREAYGLDEKVFPAPRLITIPLGVPLEDLPAPEDHWTRGGLENPGLAMRKALSLGDETIFLYFGRICPASKMDLIPLLAALRRADALGLRQDSCALVLAGWADEGDDLPDALVSYARAMGIRVRLHLRPDTEQRRGLFAAADVFVSPSDNLQETFGLTIAEACAAGLPVIASDFDGYRDIVAHEDNGLLIPTVGFASSNRAEIDALWWYDNQYHLRLAQECAVDVPQLAAALAALGLDPEKRAAMGANGRRRAIRRYSWDAVIRQYVSLWDTLAKIPLTRAEEQRLRATAHPQRMRFARYFKGHFSTVLDESFLTGLVVRRTRSGEALYRDALPMLLYTGMEHMIDRQAVKRLLLAARKDIAATDALSLLERSFEEKAASRRADVSSGEPETGSGDSGSELQANIRKDAREKAAFILLWCLKQDHLEVVS